MFQKILHILLAGFFVLGMFWFAQSFADLSWFEQLGRDGQGNSQFIGDSGGLDDAYEIRWAFKDIFNSLIIVVYVAAIFVATLATIQLVVSENSEEDWKKWRMTLVWSLVGLFWLTISHRIINSYDLSERANGVDVNYATQILIGVVYPVVNVVRYFAALVFLFAAIFSYYRIVSAGGDESGVKAGRQSFINAILGFILIIFIQPLIALVYSGTGCTRIFGRIDAACEQKAVDTLGTMGFLGKLISFLNGFVSLVVIIFILYAGFLLLTSWGDSERIGKAKKVILYALIGVAVLIFSFVIYRFFIDTAGS